MKKNNNLKLIIMEKKELYNGPQKAIYMDEEFQILLQTWGLHVPNPDRNDGMYVEEYVSKNQHFTYYKIPVKDNECLIVLLYHNDGSTRIFYSITWDMNMNFYLLDNGFAYSHEKGNDSLIETDWCLFYISPIDKKILPVHQSLKALGATMENGDIRLKIM